jgi:HSP20 family protein
MTLVRWDPVREISTLSHRFGSGSGAWSPAVDVFERGEDLVVHAELPGLKFDEIDIRVENGNLVLHGERKREDEVEDDKVYRLERVYGTFTRSFTLPTTVDTARINATYTDGVLEIVLPKAEEAKSRKVEIKVA